MTDKNKQAASYEKIAEYCSQLDKKGETPTIRLLRQEFRGSPGKISEYLNQWQSESGLAKSCEHSISTTLLNSLKAELARVAKAEQDKFHEQLAEQREKVEKAEVEILGQAEHIEKLEEQLNAEKEKHQQSIIQLEKQLSVSHERLESNQQKTNSLEKKIESLYKELDASKEKCHKMELRAVAAEAKKV